jgi:hypothetical protein
MIVVLHGQPGERLQVLSMDGGEEQTRHGRPAGKRHPSEGPRLR